MYGCLLPLFAVLMPRVTMFFIWLLTDWFSRAYETALWPFLGFLFMPFTTLAYMAAMLNNNHQVSGGWLVLLVVAVIFDLGGQGKSAGQARRPRSV
jgi:hypothetical protein